MLHIAGIDENHITGQLARFLRSGNPIALLRALRMIARERRTFEVLHSARCLLLMRPSAIARGDEQTVSRILNALAASPPDGIVLTRMQLLERYGDSFAVHALPGDFDSVRGSSVTRCGGFLVLGEYGDPGARIAVAGPGTCTVDHSYARLAGVRHIHSLYPGTEDGTVLVSTGDSRRVLDLCEVRDSGLRLIRRLRSRFAGYTALARVGNELYAGTDFSSRPNYIAMLDGSVHPFPAAAYWREVDAFQVHEDRYLCSINYHMLDACGDRTVSIFDTQNRAFIHCGPWPSVHNTA